MNFNDYQQEAMVTAVYEKAVSGKKIIEILDENPNDLVQRLRDLINRGGNLVYTSMGLAGESGEFLDKVKKLWRNKGEMDASSLSPEERKAFALEAGDALWYVAACAKELGFTLEEIAEMNIAKLRDRRARNVVKSEGDNR
jgi:NTP pyrophosphatase (non-canonical NTP hydrolase)